MCQRNIDWLPLAQSQLGTWLTTQTCALTRNRITNLSVCGMMPNPLSHTNWGSPSIFNDSLVQQISWLQVLVFHHFEYFLPILSGLQSFICLTVLMGAFMQVTNFLLLLFKILPLFFNFWHFNYDVSWDRPFGVHLVWDCVCFLDLWVFFPHQIKEIFSHYSFKQVLKPLLFLFSFWYPYDSNVVTQNVPKVPQAIIFLF